MYEVKLAAHNSASINTNDKDFEVSYQKIKQAILKSESKQDSTSLEQVQLLEELKEFPLGRFLIQHKVLDGLWNQYVVLHPQYGRLTGKGADGKPLSKLERWLLDRCPIVLATQERFFIFQKLLQNLLREDITMAAIPCGLMDDLLGLNYLSLKNFHLTGVDIDARTMQLAAENAAHNHLTAKCIFHQQDVWQMSLDAEFDVITSHGLNVFDEDIKHVTELYSILYKALKPGGTMISSFLSIPYWAKEKAEWDNSQIPQEDLRLQRVLFEYVLRMRWRYCFRSEDEMVEILKNAGFRDIEIIYDRQHIFPTILGRKKA